MVYRILNTGLLLLLVAISLPAQNLDPDNTEAAWAILKKARQNALGLEGIDPAEKAEKLIDLGLWAEARKLLDGPPETDPALAFQQARLAWLESDYSEAERFLTFARGPALAVKKSILAAELAIARWDIPQAYRIAEELSNSNNNPKAQLLLARVALAMRQYDQAIELARNVQQRQQSPSQAWYIEAEAQLWKRDLAGAEQSLKECLRRDPLNADARFAYGYVIWRRVKASQLPQMAAQWELALSLHPLHYLTHWHWGNGHTQLTFEDYVDPDEDKIRSELQPADTLIAYREYGRALGMAHALRRTYPQSVLPDLYKGSFWYMAFESGRAYTLDSAISTFQSILERKPHFGPAHNGLAAAIKRKRMTYLGGYDTLEANIAATVIENRQDLEAVFPDVTYYPGDRVANMVWSQLHTCTAYLPMLRKLDRNFRIPPLHQDLALAMENKWFREATTFDNRQWMDIRGVGSGATGIEYVERGSHLERNVLLHEYVHLFDGSIFTETEKHRVRQLYAQAMQEDRVLDYYAANNESEYLAQAIPAFFSEVKVHPLNHKSMNTRADLEQKDPELFAFIDSLTDRYLAFVDGNSQAMAGNWAQTYVTLAQHYQKADSPLTKIEHLLDTALDWDARYLPALLARTHIYLERDETEKAENWLGKALALNPNHPEPYFLKSRLTLSKANKEDLGDAVLTSIANDLNKAGELSGDENDRARYARALWETLWEFARPEAARQTALAYVDSAESYSTYLRDRRDEALVFAWTTWGLLGYPEEVSRRLDSVLAAHPQTQKYRLAVGQMFIDLGMNDQAIKILKPAYDLENASGNPSDALSAVLALAYARQGQLGITREVAGNISSKEQSITAAQVWCALDSLDRVDQMLEKSDPSQLPREIADRDYLKGLIAEARGEKTAAESHFRQALDQNPYHLGAMKALLDLGDRRQRKKVRKDLDSGLEKWAVPPGPAIKQFLDGA